MSLIYTDDGEWVFETQDNPLEGVALIAPMDGEFVIFFNTETSFNKNFSNLRDAMNYVEFIDNAWTQEFADAIIRTEKAWQYKIAEDKKTYIDELKPSSENYSDEDDSF